MKNCSLILLILVSILSVGRGQTPTFDCGSNGSYGPMNIAVDTMLTLPPDGIFHCTTVNISQSRRLSFARNSANTPVYILATGDVVITGSIYVSGGDSGGSLAGGVGGPGGFDGGVGGETPSNGLGPGGGLPGTLATSAPTTGNAGVGVFRIQLPQASGSGQPYGSPLLIPLIGGSGGGGAQGTSTGRGGGGGGGAILIASNTRIIVNGAIVSNGGIGGTQGNVATNGGSGGAVRLVAPKISGNPNLNVNSQSLGFNSPGRIRIDTYDRSGIERPLSDVSFGSVMVVFPATLPKLSIVNVAGTEIAVEQTNPVSLILPAGTAPNQVVRVQARDFGGLVPIRVRLVPEFSSASTFDATIDNTVTNPATVDVPVTFPVNTGVRVEVFTR